MNAEVSEWLAFAQENADVAALALAHGHLNACLQNAQQAVEKALKACLVARGVQFPKTHSIGMLTNLVGDDTLAEILTENVCDLMDSIYLPSKYPSPGVLPDGMPDEATCRQAMDIAQRTVLFAAGARSGQNS